MYALIRCYAKMPRLYFATRHAAAADMPMRCAALPLMMLMLMLMRRQRYADAARAVIDAMLIDAYAPLCCHIIDADDILQRDYSLMPFC